MAVKYKEQQKNTKLDHYTTTGKMVCRMCGREMFSSTVTIAEQGGDTALCYHCNVRMGLIR